MPNQDKPLVGLTVVDLSVTIPGPYATMLLHRLGARIIKFEPPAGDMTRMFGHMHDALNAGKESVRVNLKDAEDLALVTRVARQADVIVEGWRPGVAKRLGLGYEEISASNTRLVYCSISGWGAEGPWRDRAGHDINYAAEAGALYAALGNRPAHNLGLPIADLSGGTFAALRILAALHAVDQTGAGCWIDTSLAGAIRDWVTSIGGEHDPLPMASLELLPHYGTFDTSDGHTLTIGIVNEDHFWRELCGILDLQSLADLDLAARGQRSDELRAALTQAIGVRQRVEIEPLLDKTDTCWAFVDPSTGSSPIAGMISPSAGQPPALDQHSEAIRAEFP